VVYGRHKAPGDQERSDIFEPERSEIAVGIKSNLRIDEAIPGRGLRAVYLIRFFLCQTWEIILLFGTNNRAGI
jgi:hypothetical protein